MSFINEIAKKPAKVFKLFPELEPILQPILQPAEEPELKEISDFEDLTQLKDHYKAESKAIKDFITWNHPEGVVCPVCSKENPDHNKDRIYTYESGIFFKCRDCDRNFSYTTGTVCQNTKISIRKWFIAIYVFNIGGCTTKVLREECGISKKAAIHVLQRLKISVDNANERFTFNKKSVLQGDEAVSKGKNVNKKSEQKDIEPTGRSKQINSKIWFGLIDEVTRRLKLFHIPTTDEKIILTLIKKFVALHSIIKTDEYRSYKKLRKNLYKHFVVNHNAKQWVNGSITTNLIECIWTHLKRLIHHVYGHVSAKYMQMYLNEFTHRFNLRLVAIKDRFKDGLKLVFKHAYVSGWAIRKGLAGAVAA